MMMSNELNGEFQWARYRGQYYMCSARNNTHAYIVHPNATGPGVVRLDGTKNPLLAPAMLWAPLSQVEIFADKRTPLPQKPFTPGLQIGARCEWGTSLGEWAVCELKGDRAVIRQTTGWASEVPFEVSVSELKLLAQPLALVPDVSVVRVAS